MLQLGAAAFQEYFVVFLLPLLAKEQQRLSPYLKIGLTQCECDKFGFPAPRSVPPA